MKDYEEAMKQKIAVIEQEKNKNVSYWEPCWILH